MSNTTGSSSRHQKPNKGYLQPLIGQIIYGDKTVDIQDDPIEDDSFESDEEFFHSPAAVNQNQGDPYCGKIIFQ